MFKTQDIEVQPVDSKKDREVFLAFPWRVQEKDPFWVPPVLAFQRKLIHPQKGPFFDFGDAQLFVAYAGGEPVGRISAHINKRHDAIHKDDTGFFGFFECVDDKNVSSALFDAAASWLKDRGKKRVVGPLSFGIYDEVGLLVEGFDSLPAIMQTHNPPYYFELLDDWGFTKAIDWYALKMERSPDLNVDIEGMKTRLNQIMEKNDLRLTSPKPSDVVKRRDEVRQLFNDSWSANWGHVPFTEEQFDEIIKELKPALRTDLMRIILNADNEIAAFIISIPDLNPTIQKMGGKLNIINLLRLYYEARFKPLSKIRTVLLGVRRDYQRQHLHHALILNSYIDFYTNGISFCDCSLVPEDLKLYLRALKRYNAVPYKTWRLFEREI